MQSKSILTVLIVFLSLTIIIEIVYLFFWKTKANSNIPVEKDNSISITNTTPTPNNEDSAIPQENIEGLNNLNIYKKGVLKSANLEFILSGKILSLTDVEQSNEVNEIINFKKIVLEGDLQKTNTFTFSDEYENLEIVDLQNNSKKISLDELRIGDSIIIEVNANIMGQFKESIKIKRV